MTIFYVFGYLSMVSVLPALVLSFRRRGHPSLHLRILLLGSLLADVLGIVLSYTIGNSAIVSNLFLWIQFSVCALILVYSANRWIKRIARLAIVLYFVVAAYNLFILKLLFDFFSAVNSLAGLLIFILCIRFFYVLARDRPVRQIEKYPLFWIVMAITFYYGGNLFLFLLNNLLLKTGHEIHMGYWLLHSVLNTFKNVLFAVGLWQMTLSKS